MAATVVLYEYTGTNAGTTTSSNKFGGSIVLRAADMPSETTPGSNPIVKSGATVYSWERHLRMQCTVAPTVSLTAPKFFGSASADWGTGVQRYAKTTTSATGATPAQASTTTGFDAGGTSGFGLTANRKALGTYTVTTTGALGDFLILMCTVGTTASAGTAGSETWTWAYDEA